MATSAEIDGLKAVAASMSVKDLKWQIKNAEKTGVTDPDILEIFKNELSAKQKAA